MKLSSKITPLWVSFVFASGVAVANSSQDTKVDNSEMNQRDQQSNTVTADDQASGSKTDVETTRLVRRALTKDSHLSVYAQNIKIITLNGTVTLRGPVHSAEERMKVASIAQNVVHRKNAVVNELEIKQ